MIGLLTATLIYAAAPTPDPVYVECSNDTKACYSYVLGVIETTLYLGRACPTGPIAVAEVTEHVLALMNARGDAESKALSFSGLTIAALESNYPCK